jgi:hypothetical protein
MQIRRRKNREEESFYYRHRKQIFLLTLLLLLLGGGLSFLALPKSNDIDGNPVTTSQSTFLNNPFVTEPHQPQIIFLINTENRTMEELISLKSLQGTLSKFFNTTTTSKAIHFRASAGEDFRIPIVQQFYPTTYWNDSFLNADLSTLLHTTVSTLRIHFEFSTNVLARRDTDCDF